MQVLNFIVYHCQLNTIGRKWSRCWCKMANVQMRCFFLAVIICPKQFECVLASAAILTVTAKHHGEEMYGPPCGLSPDTLHIYCMWPSAEYGSVCYTVTWCFTMICEKEPHMWFVFVSGLHHLSNQHLTPASFNNEIMDLECFGK